MLISVERTRVCMAAILGCCCASATIAAAATFRTNTCPVRLDGTRLGSDLTSGGSSLRNTVAYEPSTHLYHLWVLANNDPNFPTSSVLSAFTHATSSDGIQFSSDGNLTYGVGSARYQDYGATIDPPLDFLRAVFDISSGTWKLFAWSENDQQSPRRWGQYTYNTSANDLGTVASNTSVLHQGPLNSPVAGNHVGTFGLVDDKLYLRVDSATGGDGQFAYTDAVPPATGADLGEADLYAGTPYCWFLQPSCGTSDPRIPAYVHNVGRTLRQTDGTLATYYAFRHVDGTRLDKQIWYVASTDNAVTWSAPAGVFADGGAITVDGQPIASDGNFSNVDSVQAPNVCRMYFSTKDTAGNAVMVSATTGGACDSLFADGFEGCGD